MAGGSFYSWSDFARIWGEITGQKVVYKQVTTEQMVGDAPDRDFGIELAEMFTYCSKPGYDGAMDLMKAEDLRKVCIMPLYKSILMM